MGECKINNTKHLKALITQAKSESICLSPNKSQLSEIESLSLQIHKNYLTAITEQKKIGKNILSLEAKLEESITNLEYYKDALIRLLIPHEFNLTLVYKIQTNIPYIKGRVYWDNKQREVQIGTIENVISKIKKLSKKGLIPPIKGIEQKNMEWAYIKTCPEIESAIKYLGKIKFKQYLLKHFHFPKSKSHSPQLIRSDFNNIKDEEKLNDGESPHNLIGSKDWYSLWRKDNL